MVVRSADGASDGRHGLAPDVALIVTEHGDGCIVDLDGSFYAVSPVAAAMLRDTLDGGRDAAVARSAARYGVDEARIADDLDALLKDLTARGLLLRRRDGRRASGPQRIIAGALAGVAHRLLRLAATQRSRAWIALTFARLSFVISGWNATVTAYRTRAGDTGAAPVPQAGELVRAIDSAIRSAASRHPLNVDCKERALASFALARYVGLPATLVVGIGFYPLAGHSWCETGNAVIGDESTHCRRFTPAFRLS
ncbi:MAG: lasso peptide biosynthesis B2 protein [Reyranellaceae bacterium]